MKQLLLSSFLTLSMLSFVQAQSIIINPNPVDSSFSIAPFDDEFLDLEIHTSVKNNTTETLHLKWVREIPSSCSDAWKTLVCDNVQCYSEGVSTNYNLAIGLDQPFTLQPGETFPNFLFHVRPHMTAGCCPAKVHLSTIEDPDVILATIDYDIRINDPNCSLSSTQEPAVLDAITAYPNPTPGLFSISENPLVKKVVLFNLLGRQVRSFEHTNGKLYDITDAPDGLYLVSMQDANGEIIKTMRITKQDLRP